MLPMTEPVVSWPNVGIAKSAPSEAAERTLNSRKHITAMTTCWRYCAQSPSAGEAVWEKPCPNPSDAVFGVRP